MGKIDSEVMDRVGDEVKDIKDANHTESSKPVSYEPLAWTRQGNVD